MEPEDPSRFTGGSKPPGILYFECAARRYSDMLCVVKRVDRYHRSMHAQFKVSGVAEV